MDVMMSSCLLNFDFNDDATKSHGFSFRDGDLKFLLTQMFSLDHVCGLLDVQKTMKC